MSGYRILLVDDDPFFLQYAGAILRGILLDEMMVKRLSHAVQALELEIGAAAGEGVDGGDGGGVVSGELTIEPAA